jgi:hypothetical protein
MNAIHRYVEPLPGKRGQLREDIVIDGQIVQSINVGSPAPLATVERFACTIPI